MQVAGEVLRAAPPRVGDQVQDSGLRGGCVGHAQTLAQPGAPAQAFPGWPRAARGGGGPPWAGSLGESLADIGSAWDAERLSGRGPDGRPAAPGSRGLLLCMCSM
ncbi:hypothetical protein GCM10025734_21020 [Kitasatospora paranensis]